MLDKTKLVKKNVIKDALNFESFVETLKRIGFVVISNVITHPKVEESVDPKKGSKMPDIGSNRGWQFIEVDIDETDNADIESKGRNRVTIGNSLYARATLQAKLTQDDFYYVNADVEKLYADHEKETLNAIYKTELKRYTKEEKKKSQALNAKVNAIVEADKKEQKKAESTKK